MYTVKTKKRMKWKSYYYQKYKCRLKKRLLQNIEQLRHHFFKKISPNKPKHFFKIKLYDNTRRSYYVQKKY